MFKKMQKMYLEEKELLTLAFPIVMGNIGHMLIVLGDTLVAGRYSTNTLGVLGVACGIINAIFIIGIGLMMFSPILSKKLGEGHQVHDFIPTLFCYSLLISLLIFILTTISLSFLDLFGISPELIDGVKKYIFVFSLSYPFAFLLQAIKEFLQAIEKVMFANIVIIMGAVLNLCIAYYLTLGIPGYLPEMGVIGLGVAAIIVRAILFLVLLFYFLNYYPYKKWAYKIDFKFIYDVLKICLPLALGLFAELAAFSGASSLIVGHINPIQAAVHNVVINLTGITFMVPLAISVAVSIKIGYFFGKHDLAKIRRLSLSGLRLTIMFIGLSACVFYLFSVQIASLFTDDVVVINLTSKLLLLVALFQLFDGIQVTIGGILRGMEITTPYFLASLFGYWFLGIPLAYYLAIMCKMEAFGLWLALTIAIFILAGIMCFALMKYTKRSFVSNNTYTHTKLQTDI